MSLKSVQFDGIENTRTITELGRSKLLATQVGKGEAYGKPLSSLGGFAPYEYTDAGGGVTEGGYTITGAHVL